MLDQRRAQENGFITLREAAALTNYSSDYIGQLIRNGKIRGEQVYSNVAWVTTEEEVRAYMADKTRTVVDDAEVKRIEALGERAFSYLLYTVIGLLIVGILLLQYIFYTALDKKVTTKLMTMESVSEQSI